LAYNQRVNDFEMRSATLREADGDGLVVHLPARPPLRGDKLLAFLGARAILGVEEIVDGAYRRTIRTGERMPRSSCVRTSGERRYGS